MGNLFNEWILFKNESVKFPSNDVHSFEINEAVPSISPVLNNAADIQIEKRHEWTVLKKDSIEHSNKLIQSDRDIEVVTEPLSLYNNPLSTAQTDEYNGWRPLMSYPNSQTTANLLNYPSTTWFLKQPVIERSFVDNAVWNSKEKIK